MPRKSRSTRSAERPAVDPLVQEPLFGVTSDIFVPGISDATDSILAFLAEPGTVEPTFTNAPKVRNGSKAAKRRNARNTRKPSARKAEARSVATAPLVEVVEESPKVKVTIDDKGMARRSSRKVATTQAPKGSLTVVPLPKGEQVPEGKLCRIRWTVTYKTSPKGKPLTFGRRFRMFRKAEAAADILVNRGFAVTLTPERVLFTRKPKAA